MSITLSDLHLNHCYCDQEFVLGKKKKKKKRNKKNKFTINIIMVHPRPLESENLIKVIDISNIDLDHIVLISYCF